MRWISLKRVVFGLATSFVVAGVAVGFCWRSLLAEWHKREIVRLSPVWPPKHLDHPRRELLECGCAYVSEMTREEQPRPLLYQLSQRFWAWPDAAYFHEPDRRKVPYHEERLLALGYVQKEKFTVEHWAFRTGAESLPDCPIRESKATPGFDWKMYSGLANADEMNKAWKRGTKCKPRWRGTLIVTDLPSRLPLWRAFVEKHNGGEAGWAGR